MLIAQLVGHAAEMDENVVAARGDQHTLTAAIHGQHGGAVIFQMQVHRQDAVGQVEAVAGRGPGQFEAVFVFFEFECVVHVRGFPPPIQLRHTGESRYPGQLSAELWAPGFRLAPE